MEYVSCGCTTKIPATMNVQRVTRFVWRMDPKHGHRRQFFKVRGLRYL